MTDYLTWKTKRAEALTSLEEDARNNPDWSKLSKEINQTLDNLTSDNLNKTIKNLDEAIKMEKLLHPMISIYVGKVIWFDSKKGFGFISRENQLDIFVHFSDIVMDGYKNLIKDQTVQFQIGENYFGKPKAIKVSLVSLASP